MSHVTGSCTNIQQKEKERQTKGVRETDSERMRQGEGQNVKKRQKEL